MGNCCFCGSSPTRVGPKGSIERAVLKETTRTASFTGAVSMCTCVKLSASNFSMVHFATVTEEHGRQSD